MIAVPRELSEGTLLVPNAVGYDAQAFVDVDDLVAYGTDEVVVDLGRVTKIEGAVERVIRGGGGGVLLRRREAIHRAVRLEYDFCKNRIGRVLEAEA